MVSDNIYNLGPAELVIVLPLTSTYRGVPYHVPIRPPEGGVRMPSVILCDAIRCISKERLRTRCGIVSAVTLAAVEDQLRVLMSL